MLYEVITRDEVQGPLATLIARMLDPDEGYASSLEAQQDLERLLAGNADAAAKPESVGQPQLHAQAKRNNFV